ncbi:MAG: hypothetical protein RLY70_4467, partial [Planctomycetota bacterium]
MASFTAEPQATAGPPNRVVAAQPNAASNPASPAGFAVNQAIGARHYQQAIGARHYRGIS